jgi:hypothetical protein
MSELKLFIITVRANVYSYYLTRADALLFIVLTNVAFILTNVNLKNVSLKNVVLTYILLTKVAMPQKNV